MNKICILVGLVVLIFIRTVGLSQSAVSVFTTGGHTVYHLRPAFFGQGKDRVIISATYDGSVLCHTPEGKLHWKTQTGGNFPFDLCVADVNGDGKDEVLVASGDGVLYAIDSNGKHLWSFKKEFPLYQVCAAKQPDGSSIILTGGVEQVLYALSPTGQLRGQLSVGSFIRHLRAGDILGDGREYVAMATTTGALAGTLGLSLLDPAQLKFLWTRNNVGEYLPNSGRRFFSMAMMDLDHDGKQEIALSGSWGEKGKIYAYDGEGNQRFATSDPRIPDVPYRMNILVPVRLPQDEYIIGQFGNILIVYNLDGSCREVVTGQFSYANASFDPITRVLYCGSEVSGGDEVVAIHLDKPGWQKDFAAAKPVGKLAKVIANMQTLKSQVASFKAPAYQPASRKADVLLMEE